MEPGPLVLVLNIGGLNVQLGQLAADEAGTDQTIGAMLAVVRHAAKTKPVKDRARRLGTPRAIYDYLRDGVRFMPDPLGVEYIRHPSMLVTMIDTFGKTDGDCDDLATCAAALLKAAGYTPVFAVVSRRETRNGQRRYEHVFPGYMPKPGLPLEARNVVPMEIQTRVPIGEWPDARLRRLYLATGDHA